MVPGELFDRVFRFLMKTSTHSAVMFDTCTPRKSPIVALSISVSKGMMGPSFSYDRMPSTKRIFHDWRIVLNAALLK